MEHYTVETAAELAGVSENTLRQHIKREKVRVVRHDGRVMIAEDDLHAYMIAEGLEEVAREVKAKPVEQIAAEVEVPLHVLIGRLPPPLADALIEGMRTGSPEPYRRALAAWNESLEGKPTRRIGDIPYVEKEGGAVPKGR